MIKFIILTLFNINPSFNTNEILQQIAHCPIKEKKQIIIKDKSYKATFDEDGVILKATEKENNTEDALIPVYGKPEIRNGKVIYKGFYGEISFEGTDRGLRFEQSSPYPPISAYSNATPNLCFNSSKSGEFLVDTNIAFVPTVGGSQYRFKPSIAFDGTNYFVVWENKHYGTDYPRIYGARVSKSGVFLDSAGIAISSAPSWHPSVAFDGTNYFVVWNGDTSIYGARVSTSGIVLDSQAIAISPQGLEPSLIFGTTNYFAVWRYGSNIYGTRINPAGIVLDTTKIVITDAPSVKTSPFIAFDGANYFVVWEDNRNDPGKSTDIYGTFVSQDGTVSDTSGIPISTAQEDQRCPTVAFDGTNYLVVWGDLRVTGTCSDIYGVRMNTSGAILDSPEILISTAPNWQEEPFICFNNPYYLVAWFDFRSDTGDIYGARINTGGIVLDTQGIPLSTAPFTQLYPSIGTDSTNYFLVWRERIEDYEHIYGARVDTSGTVLDQGGNIISTTAYSQYSPSAAFDGINYFTVWEDYRNDLCPNIYGARISGNNTILDPQGIRISTASYSQRNPSVAFDGTNYFVVWEGKQYGTDYYHIYGTRVTPTGKVLDSLGISISDDSTWQTGTSVAFDGVNYLVVWGSWRGAANICGARVNPSGTVLDTEEIHISTLPDSFFYAWCILSPPSIAFNGTNYLVVYSIQDNWSASAVYANRVNPEGVALDSNAIHITPIRKQYVFNPKVSSDSANYFVVWEDYRSFYLDIYGTRVDNSGIVLDTGGLPISTASYNQRTPSINFDGTHYFVLWDDYRNECIDNPDIYGSRVNTSGKVVDSFAVSTQIGNQNTPSVVKGADNQLLITYSGFVPTINNRPANTMRIWGKFYSVVGTEEQSYKQAYSLNIFPNPVIRKTTINYQLANKTLISLKLYDLTGRCVKTLVNGEQIPGYYKAELNSKDYPTGIYFAKFKAGNYKETKKLILMK
ncbi:MAG: T9SS type A sorting domain-containing protein [bacterium]